MKQEDLKEKNGMYGKSHTEETREKMRKKAEKRYTLFWFVERYGEEEGVEKYLARNKNKSEKSKGELNKSYKKVNKEVFISDVLSGISKKDLAEKHGVAFTALQRRLRDFFGTDSFKEVRRQYGLPVKSKSSCKN